MMNNPINNIIKRIMIIIPAFLIAMTLSAQDDMDNNSYQEANKEIKETFGTVPTTFEVFPKHALANAWESFKQMHNLEGEIPPKYRELIQLAAAAEIPCDYCVYFQSKSAQSFGTTEEKTQEDLAHGATTRHTNMKMQGDQVDFENLKNESDAMMNFLAEKLKK